jgi:acylglycerol lipase
MSNPFSFTEIQQIPPFELQQPAFIKASDGCELAYYLYAPKEPRAICILYHGAGFYGGMVYQYIAKNLAKDHNIATYVMDIRGHGNSQGPRGDAPSLEAVWDDVSTALHYARKNFANLPIYLAGHSSGAGLILNYAIWPKHIDFDGLILLAPYLGIKSGVQKEYVDPRYQFVKSMRVWVMAIAGISNGYFCAHTPAIYFNYPFETLQDDKILKYYTATMSMATAPYEIENIITKIQSPTAMFIASHDEQFKPEILTAWANKLPKDIKQYVEVVDAKHLTILLDSAELIAKGINHLK